VIRSCLNWFDERTGFRRMLAPVTRRVLPLGPRWSLVTASCLLWVLVVEVVTGLLLMASYSPSTTTAWASVHYLEQIDGGSFLRGLHFFAGQALIILFGLHTIRVLLAAAFRAPHELVWATGLFLIPLILVWAITGNPLAGTQKGYSQIEVEGNIIGSTPVVGPVVQRILIGGDEVGHLTLTHLYFLHVALMPLLVGCLLVVHVGQVYRHGISTDHGVAPTSSATPYFPYQTIRNLVAVSVVLAIVAGLALWYGAPLDAPADPELPRATRPEWYFLFLFELRGYFVGELEYVATVVIPVAVLALLLAMPLIDRMLPERLGKAVRYAVVLAGVGTWTSLTAASAVRDWNDPAFQTAAREAEELGDRAGVLAARGEIPPEGAAALLRHDAKTQGPALYTQHCASCHAWLDEAGRGIASEEPSAPNLYGFASRNWLADMMDPETIDTHAFFGNTIHNGEEGGMMVDYVQNTLPDYEPDDIRKMVMALSAEAELASQADLEARDGDEIAEGIELLTAELGCIDCHMFHEEGDLGTAPDLTGYGNREWLAGMIADPNHERFYPDDTNDRMPAFAPRPAEPQENLLQPREIQILVDWLRGEWYEPVEP